MVTPDLPHGSFDWLTFPRDDLDMHPRDWFLAREPGSILMWDILDDTSRQNGLSLLGCGFL